MSPLAKVFVVLNLILALGFLAVSATLFQTQENWKEVAENRQDELMEKAGEFSELKSSLEGTITSLSKDRESLSAKNQLLESQNNDYQNENSDLKKSVAERDTRISRLETEKSKLEDDIRGKDDQIDRLTQTNDRLRTEAEEAREAKTAAELAMSRAVLDKQQIAEDLEQASIQSADFRKRAEDAEALISRAKATGIKLDEVMFPNVAPPIDGVVAAVDPSVDIVVLSVGEDDKVRNGHEFTIYRGDRFVAKVQVTRVTSDMSGARVLFMEPGEEIKVGDLASTRLN